GALSALGLTEAEARAAALSDAEAARLEEAFRAWTSEHEQHLRAALDLETRLAGRSFEPQALETARTALAKTEGDLQTASTRVGELGQTVATAEERLGRKRELVAATAAISRDLDTWAALAQAMKANEFQQYLLAEIESRLLERAGELLFEISDGRYRLLLVDGEYSVQDLWNAGETRGVKTLSGGETFLASLALAVALSDYLAGNRILGALFLDEGFGTLDPQALEAVAGALEKVRTQGRMVGVITHVESLSERLPARILVTKSVAGSRAARME
uniref:AAA family ATPase n=1 Tax=Deinococcus pimensis TaxID=309888 RepID=UPI0005EBE0F1